MQSNKKNYLFFVFSLLIVLFLSFLLNIILGPNLVLAIEVELPGLGQNPSLPQYVSYIFNFVMQMAGTLAVMVIMFGGIHYLVSFGMGKITSEGKEWIKAGILGLLILLSSWLIMYTINPDLIKLKMTPLGFPIPTINIPTVTPEKIVPIAVYYEIPIGTLTETLLTRTMDCYDFDFRGDPIDGNATTAGWEPTLMGHDRVDCILKLSEAFEKKSKIFSDLSEEIAKLMENCSCRNIENCDLNCSTCQAKQSCGPNLNGLIGTNIPCKGDCVRASCKGEKECCLPEVKEKIEHGPIPIKDCEDGPGKNYKGLDEYRTDKTTILPTMEEEIDLNDKKVKVIKKEEWEKAKLIEQLMYLKEKLSKLKEEFKLDLNNLKNAETKLTKCYLSKSYFDFLKIKEKSDKNNIKIEIQKPFKDPSTEKSVDISEYCKGFGWSDTSRFNTCQKICSPGINLTSFQGLKGCGDNIDCIKTNYYKCGNNDFGFKSFQDCLITLGNQCKELCQKKYQNCPDFLEECENLCLEDSKFLFEQESCYVNFQVLGSCAKTYSVFEDFKRCVESSMCIYCTDQYAGYPDCLKKPVQKSEPYSSLYLYQNPTRHKDYLSAFFATIFKKDILPPLYPESAKCPFFSKCPQCPCKNAECTKLEEKCLFCGAECMDFSYNDDPLTFYCSTDWWEEAYGRKLEEILLQEKEIKTTILAETKVCPKEREIPVGQTVDEAEAWAEELMKNIKDFTEKTENIIQYIKGIGEEKNYCKCDSKCSDSENPCDGDCIFWQEEVPVYDEDGNQTGTKLVCGCNPQPCSGNPCLKMINLLRGKKADEKCPEGTEYKGVKWYYEEIQKALEKLKKSLEQNRPEILKRLIYSRKKANECSTISTVFQKETMLISCTMMKDYNIDPISTWETILAGKVFKSYCYGNLVGKILGTELMDNWQCCKKRIK
ncbi:hypothetical protein KKC49_01550 [Patescibacteria group bacterium]|nr:hypothetical protein [Patescibacteria group bacterium]